MQPRVLSAELLADVNRWVGVLAAMVGAVIAAPSGARELVTSTWRWLQRRGNQVHHHLARLLPFLRRDGTAQGTSAVGSAIATSWAVLTAEGWAWPASAPTDERIEALRKHILEVEGRLNDVRRQLRDETRAREQSVAELERKIRIEIEQLQQSIISRDRQSARIDARGLPVIAAGIFLSGVPDQLAHFLYPLGWLWVFIVVTVCMVVSISAWRAVHAEQRLRQIGSPQPS